MLARFACRSSRALTSPWEEARRSVIVKANNGVGEDDGALEEEDHGEDDEEWHRDEDTRLLL